MIAGNAQKTSLELGQPDISRLLWALGISLALHLGGYGGYELGKKFDVWRRIHWPQWLKQTQVFASSANRAAQPQVQPEVPLVFVNVSPSQSSPDEPKDAKYYSDKNSLAANPDPTIETGAPKIDGKQSNVAKTETTPRVNLDRLQPDFDQLARERQAQASKPKTTQPPGDLVMAKPDVSLRQGDGFTEHSRPRTVKEALLRQNRTQLVGEKMKQDGGVSRMRLDPGFDVKSSPFGSYDAAFIEAIQSRWYNLLDQISYDNYRSGRVLIRFRLHYDGQITDLLVLEENVGTMLTLMCQAAIRDPAPYERWPEAMRRIADKDYREISFTFYYNRF